jgi:hypothetical protein
MDPYYAINISLVDLFSGYTDCGPTTLHHLSPRLKKRSYLSQFAGSLLRHVEMLEAYSIPGQDLVQSMSNTLPATAGLDRLIICRLER